MSEHENQEQYPTRITDKRRVNKKKSEVDPPLHEADREMPSAEQLLEQGDAEQSEFERQAEEERARLAAWEDLSEDEKQAILAQQAAEEGGLPFAGGGIQTDGATKKEVLTAFAIVVDLDGTATAMPMALFDKQRDELTWDRDADARVMYRSAAEIMLDIQAADTAHLTLQMFKTVGDHMAAQQRATALAQGLSKRGVSRRG